MRATNGTFPLVLEAMTSLVRAHYMASSACLVSEPPPPAAKPAWSPTMVAMGEGGGGGRSPSASTDTFNRRSIVMDICYHVPVRKPLHRTLLLGAIWLDQDRSTRTDRPPIRSSSQCSTYTYSVYVCVMCVRVGKRVSACRGGHCRKCRV